MNHKQKTEHIIDLRKAALETREKLNDLMKYVCSPKFQSGDTLDGHVNISDIMIRTQQAIDLLAMINYMESHKVIAEEIFNNVVHDLLGFRNIYLLDNKNDDCFSPRSSGYTTIPTN